jgi:uncharacterized membrane protein ArfB
MDFVIQWSWYLLAFVAGSAVAWAIATVSIKRGQAKEPAKEEVSRGAR